MWIAPVWIFISLHLFLTLFKVHFYIMIIQKHDGVIFAPRLKTYTIFWISVYQYTKRFLILEFLNCFFTCNCRRDVVFLHDIDFWGFIYKLIQKCKLTSNLSFFREFKPRNGISLIFKRVELSAHFQQMSLNRFFQKLHHCFQTL